MDIGTMTASRLILGLKPRATGLPWVIYLHRQSDDADTMFFEVSKDLPSKLSRQAYQGDKPLRFMIEPTFMQLSGPPLDFHESAALEQWVSLNGLLIEGYWDGSKTGAEVFSGIRQIKQRW